MVSSAGADYFKMMILTVLHPPYIHIKFILNLETESNT
jgi:hypothetical protein